MTAQSTAAVRRSTAERIRETADRLAAERDVREATAHPEHGPQQVPLWFVWDERRSGCARGAASATVRNVRVGPRVRLSLPDTFDVVLVRGTARCLTDQDAPEAAADTFAAKFGWDPRTEDRPHMCPRIAPKAVRAGVECPG
ncbi:pyridoxamine 5'-phosphate oxidase family protein [Streptomyces sp. VRA16 Mangrove soil]|uniref:pyridoxamine 5'-phosphate oxidase family protein n=1 Tax=Streptomyces sp. VRA16 Mangrove soil TaxID=2817434 RepID=UPI0027DD8326|nr:pyridoxamine 5'-phosphate oxidase family protein [Streptomyces sp. VRA16 Mangrove soil]